MTRMWLGWAAGGAFILALAHGCGADDATQSSVGSGASSAGGSGGSGATGASSNGGGEGGVNLSVGGGSSGGGSQGGGCAGEQFEAQIAPLDMYIMLDASGSMHTTTAANNSRWDAVTAALGAFFNDSSSAGLGVALQYFPGPRCTSDMDCGTFGPCANKVCNGLFNTGQFCASNNDCGIGPFGGSCVTAGICSGDPQFYCWGTDCGAQGACNKPIPSSYCDGGKCDPNAYVVPEVALDVLPNHATALVSSMSAQFPFGATPTQGALQGAIDGATTIANLNPGHKVVVVLATDGEPTECSVTDANGLGQIAAAGYNGSPSVSTFVIGVVDGNAATTVLDQIAMDGGTTGAFIINPSAPDITQQFVQALTAIQGQALPCTFQIPDPGSAQQIDFNKVNLDYTPSGEPTTTVPYVGSAAGCGNGGWYYDVDPSQGTPTTIIACPETCDDFQMGGDISIVVGCQTQVPK